MGDEVLTASGYDWQDDEKKLRERLRIRSKYAQRNQERKIQMYIKALEHVRESELRPPAGKMCGQMAPSVTVKIWVNYATDFGRRLYIVGNVEEFGSWDPAGAKPMTWAEGNNWFIEISFPSYLESVQYKFLVKADKSDIPVCWEWGKNHVLNLARDCGEVKDHWGAGTA